METRRIRATVSQHVCFCLSQLSVNLSLPNADNIYFLPTPLPNQLSPRPRRSVHLEQIYQQIVHFQSSGINSYRNLRRNSCNGVIRNTTNNKQTLRLLVVDRGVVVDVSVIEVTTAQEKDICHQPLTKQRRLQQFTRVHQQSNGVFQKLHYTTGVQPKRQHPVESTCYMISIIHLMYQVMSPHRELLNEGLIHLIRRHRN